jgi:hypothetical protein
MQTCSCTHDFLIMLASIKLAALLQGLSALHPAPMLCCLQRADEEAAKVYEDFVESFKGDDPGRDGGVKTFVRGGVVAPGSRSHDATGACWRCRNKHKQQTAAAWKAAHVAGWRSALEVVVWSPSVWPQPRELMFVGMPQHDCDGVLAVVAFVHCG